MKRKIIKYILPVMVLMNCTAFASTLFNLNDGTDLYKKTDLTGALESFEQYVINNPNDKEGYWWLAKTQQQMKDEASARINFEKSYKLLAKERNIEEISFGTGEDCNLEDYFDIAAAYFEIGDLKNADFYADLMLKVNPKSSSAYFVKAQVAYNKDNREKATEFLKKAVLINNRLLDTNLARNLNITKLPEPAKENYGVYALEAYFSGNIEGAIKNLKKYSEFDRDNSQNYLNLAELYLQNDDFANAQNMINESKKLNSNDINVYLVEAKLNFKDKSPQRAAELLKKAYEINPNNADVLLQSGNYNLSIGNFEEAKKYFSTLIEINDELFEGYSGYIYALVETGEINKAKTLIAKAKQLNPESSELLFYLAKICEYQACFSDALDYIREAKIKSNNPKFYLESAKINLILKDWEKSLYDLNETESLLNISYDKKEISNLKIQNYLALNDCDSALEILANENEIDKDGILYKYNLYTLYKIQNNDKNLIVQSQILKKTKPVTVKEYVDYSLFVYDQKGFDGVMKFLDGAIKKFPNSMELYLTKIKFCFDENNQQMTTAIIKELERFNHPRE